MRICPPWVWPAKRRSTSCAVPHFELIGAVRQGDAKWSALPRRARVRKVGGGRNPGKLVPRQEHRLAADLDLHVPPAQVTQPALLQHAHQPLRVGAQVVIPEDAKDSVAGSQAAERVGDPVDAAGAVDQVAGEDDQVRVQRVAAADDFLEVGLADAAGEVQVGEVDQGKAVQRRRQSRDLDRAMVHVQPQALVSRQVDDEMMRLVVGGGRERDAIEDALDVVGAEDVGRAMEDVPLEPGGNDRHGDRPADGEVGQQGRRGGTKELAGKDLSRRVRIGRPGPPGDRRRQGDDQQEQRIGRRAT